jgi:diacylglycerol kinase family enzyme
VDIAVVVNLRARRGSKRVVDACREVLPDARVLVSQSLEDALGFARDLKNKPPSLLISAGGDGTAVALLNAMRDGAAVPDGAASGPKPRAADGGADDHTGDAGVLLDSPAFGLLPLGTGNGWANVTGAPRWRTAVDRLGHLAQRGGPLPLRRFDLVEVGGTVAPFAGTGWDAEIIDDFHSQKTGWGVLPMSARKGLAGYLQGLFTRTIPRHITEPQAEVEIVNTGADAMTVDEAGRPIPLPGGERGAVLFRGPMSVCGAATSAEWGFGFRAFPFAGIVPRRFCLRIYTGRAIEATLRMRQLWKGKHPMEKMHTWLLTRCKATFSRPVPFQVGGDRLGMRQEVEYRLAPEQVDVLDWRAIDARGLRPDKPGYAPKPPIGTA